MENRHYRVPFSVDTWEEEFESMIEGLDEFIASLAPWEAWEAWVGEQSAAEFVTIDTGEGLRNIQHIVSQYVRAISEDEWSGLEGASPEQLDKVANLLLAYIDKELQYDPHGRADDLLERFDMDTIANCMDDDIREMLRNHLHPYTDLPCTDLELVRAYLNLHRSKFSREFEIG
jgi:hypothetical protein